MKKIIRFGMFFCMLLFPVGSFATNMTEGEGEMLTSVANAYQFSFTSANGEEVNLQDFKGKVVLVVNTASKCGFTGQYKELQSLYETYKDDGLVVLAVPSADFAGQEFDEIEDVKSFTEEKYNVTFPLMDITHVKGKDAHPFYKWAADQSGLFSKMKWNFHKYLIDKNGDFVRPFGSAKSPLSPKVIEVIEAELKK